MSAELTDITRAAACVEGIPPATILALVGSVLVAVITAGGVIFAAHRNARAVIQAENIRYQHALDGAERAWRHQQRADASFRLIDAAQRARNSARQVAWFSRPHPESRLRRSTDPDAVKDNVALWNAAVSDLRLASAALEAVGDPLIARRCEEIVEATRRVMDTAAAAWKARHLWAAKRDFESIGRDEKERAEALLRNMIAAIRADLGTDRQATASAAT